MKPNYNKYLKPYAKKLRQDGTIGEALLWRELLQGKNFYGLRFNRQYPINRYIVDFICRKLKLIIEVDGKYHQNIADDDIKRDKDLSALGYKVIRIDEKDIRNDFPNVIRVLESYLPEKVMREDVGNQSP